MSQDKKFLVWSNNDPNDSFEVDAPTATFWRTYRQAHLEKLGWCVSDKPIDDEDV